MTLLDHHRKKLESSGLTLETWQRAQMHSGSVEEVREVLGYGGAGTGLVIPYSETYSRVRIDHPGPDQKRYRSPRGQTNHLYVPVNLPPSALTDVSVPLRVTEGEFKALKATQDGFPCLALPGVWSWKSRVHGQSIAISDLDRVTWKGRTAIVVFDSDLAEKPPVAWAEHALCQELRRREAHVFILRLPDGPRGEKYGVDDFLVARGTEAFKRLEMVPIADADKGEPAYLRMSDLVDAYLLRTQASHHRIRLGYPELDHVIRGVAPGEVMTILGRSGVGKTAFALNLVERMTQEGRLPTLIFSLEQPGPELFERIASMTLEVEGHEIEQRARLDDATLVDGLARVCQRWEHVIVVDRPCGIDQIDALIEGARRADFWTEPLRLVVVDYMGMIGQRRQASPYEQMSTTAKDLKNLAKRHRVAVVVLCQVNREGASGGEPLTMRMARESGVIEEAADYLLGIWRPELKEGIAKSEKEDMKGQFKIRVLKNRHGRAPWTAVLHFNDAILKIVSTGVLSHESA